MKSSNQVNHGSVYRTLLIFGEIRIMRNLLIIIMFCIFCCQDIKCQNYISYKDNFEISVELSQERSREIHTLIKKGEKFTYSEIKTFGDTSNRCMFKTWDISYQRINELINDMINRKKIYNETYFAGSGFTLLIKYGDVEIKYYERGSFSLLRYLGVNP